MERIIRGLRGVILSVSKHGLALVGEAPHHEDLFRRAFIRSFLVAALSTLALATPAHAAAPLCKGRDLYAPLAASDPAVHRQIEAAAAGTLNGRARFWRVDAPKPGIKPSWLFGTMHVSDPRITKLPAAIEAAFAGARVLAVENSKLVDPAAVSSYMAGALQHIVINDGRTLQGIVGDETWARIGKSAAARGLPGWALAGWRPWVVSFSVLALPACEFHRIAARERFLDGLLVDRFRDLKRPVVDLEEVDGQLGTLAATPEARQVMVLRAWLELDDQGADMLETTTRMYLDGRIDRLWAFANAMMRRTQAFSTARVSEKELWVEALDTRNAGMVASAVPLVAEGNAFIAAGAAHLIGETGLVEGLKRAGYRLTPIQ